MRALIAGLVLFLGLHGVRIYAEEWRTRMIGRIGAGAWKGLYALGSLAGIALIVWGFGSAREHPVLLWSPPLLLRHLNALFTLLAFVLLAAAYVPGNHLKAGVGHPMLAGVKLWALGHLLATGTLRDAVLFGAFLLWAVADFAVSRRRDRRQGVRYPPGSIGADLLAVAVGITAWALVAFWLHARLFGVSTFA